MLLKPSTTSIGKARALFVWLCSVDLSNLPELPVQYNQEQEVEDTPVKNADVISRVVEYDGGDLKPDSDQTEDIELSDFRPPSRALEQSESEAKQPSKENSETETQIEEKDNPPAIVSEKSTYSYLPIPEQSLKIEKEPSYVTDEGALTVLTYLHQLKQHVINHATLFQLLCRYVSRLRKSF